VSRSDPKAGAIAVALHDIEPATFERCALMRDWLDDLGVGRVTLLVIPAPDLHPFHDRRPELADWLASRVTLGDSVAQHGLQDSAGEFAGLDDGDTRRAVAAGRRLLRLAGVEPRGFVAPAYAYTPELQRVLADAPYRWWAGSHRLWTGPGQCRTVGPALGLGSSSALRRCASPVLVRAAARLGGPLLRLDLRPTDLDLPGHVGAVEGVLRRNRFRRALTYDDIATG
jgi:predicted deacetylase